MLVVFYFYFVIDVNTSMRVFMWTETVMGVGKWVPQRTKSFMTVSRGPSYLNRRIIVVFRFISESMKG